MCAFLAHKEKCGEEDGKKERENNEQPICCGFMHFVRPLDFTVSTVQFTAAIFHMRFHASRGSQPALSPDIFTISSLTISPDLLQHCEQLVLGWTETTYFTQTFQIKIASIGDEALIRFALISCNVQTSLFKYTFYVCWYVYNLAAKLFNRFPLLGKQKKLVNLPQT